MKVLLLVGTKRGLFRLTSDQSRKEWKIDGPHLRGREVYYASVDPRTGAVWASSAHSVWGAHLHRSADLGETWELLENAPHYSDERGLVSVWCIAPGPANQPGRLYAGIEPAGLFRSDDGGSTWCEVKSLNSHPTASTWQPAGAALALHSIEVDPAVPSRIYCAVSAGGAYRSDDSCLTWKPINDSVRAEFLPRRVPEAGQCVHRLRMHPAKTERLYQQNHCGVYRSDDCGDSWMEITNGLPSDFGYALALDANDPDVAYVVPEESSEMRAVFEGSLRVYRTEDAGSTWRACTEGLPQHNAWVSILREGMSTDGLDPCGIYLGTSSGHLFGSRTRGDTWQTLAEYLPRILCVSAHIIK